MFQPGLFFRHGSVPDKILVMPNLQTRPSLSGRLLKLLA
ncbi:hypothetical protein RCAP_rcc02867 [Rhodobacter capsulatus SB 1003]|uniref:Uncharacterized protein n=1 Tax=Rhodobacter capsulatus (strain ATCC BAA-309 / NBRC 16581 / SB1003) TaxID=272942 RepID=D5APM7_RHOCB|nr:hypothetical protein RCAP_rcc02867 [Rhodobacter capsulatus SB 1003]